MAESGLEDLRRRVERLEARAEIGELVSAYAIACDEHDIPRLGSLFSEDAVFDTPSRLMQANGRQGIVDMFNNVLGIRGPGYHWTHDHFVRFGADADQATGLVLSHAETTPNGEPSLAAMRYEDVYRRVSGRWLFAKRAMSFLYYVPARDYLSALNGEFRLTVSGQRKKADYPESLASWQEFDARHGQGKAA